MRTYAALAALVLASSPSWGQDCKKPENVKTEYCRQQLEREMAALLNKADEPVNPLTLKSKEEIKTFVDNQVAEANRKIAAYGPVAVPSAQKYEANKDLCKAAIADRLKDPFSAQFRDIKRANKPMPELDQDTYVWHAGVRYTLDVNAKNGMGGYTGFKGAACVFNLDEDRVLFVNIYQ